MCESSNNSSQNGKLHSSNHVSSSSSNQNGTNSSPSAVRSKKRGDANNDPLSGSSSVAPTGNGSVKSNGSASNGSKRSTGDTSSTLAISNGGTKIKSPSPSRSARGLNGSPVGGNTTCSSSRTSPAKSKKNSTKQGASSSVPSSPLLSTHNHQNHHHHHRSLTGGEKSGVRNFVYLQGWQLLSLAVSLFLPKNSKLLWYLKQHLARNVDTK